jgi:acetyl esterase/lipase
LVVLSSAILLPHSARLGAGLPARGVETRRDVVFATLTPRKAPADWYGPSAPGSYPALIAIHGGGWQAGDKIGYRHWGPFLAQRGYVVLAIKYRLSKPGQKAYPHAVHDVRAAVQFAKQNAADLRVNADRIGLIGDSAGGHLAALVGLAGDHPTFAGAYQDDPYARQSAKVKAIVGIYGVYDFPAQWLHDQVHRPTDQITEKFVGLKPMDDRKLYFDVSPLSYATFSNAGPSVFLAWARRTTSSTRRRSPRRFSSRSSRRASTCARRSFRERLTFWMWDPIEEPDSRYWLLAPRTAALPRGRL